jgi:small nuclear ribonucleoprotein (snRNP)-like protein
MKTNQLIWYKISGRIITFDNHLNIISDNEDHFNNIEAVFYEHGRKLPISGLVYSTCKKIHKV